MKKQFFDRMIERPYSRNVTVTWIIFYLFIVVLMANLDAIVGSFLHPDIPYFDREHLVVGSTIGVASSLLFGAVILYSIKVSKALAHARELEAKRKSCETRYGELFQDSLDGIFIMNPGGYFTDLNPSGVVMLGFESATDLARTNLEKDLALRREQAVRFFYELSKYGVIKDYEMGLSRRDGSEILVSINANAVKGEDGSVQSFRGIMRDITNRRLIDQQVINAQRMESIGKMAKGIAHQFNDVMTAIQGYAGLAASELDQDSSIRVSIDHILKAAERAEKLTRELMVFSRQQKLVPRTYNINHLVEAAREMVGCATGNKTDISMMLFADPALVNVDAASLENALVNMVMFAGDRTSANGEVKIITGNTAVDGDYCERHPEAHEGDFLTLTVEDRGQELSAGDIERVFEPFSGVDGVEDSGLQMSVVYGVAVQHDGWVQMESTPTQTRTTIFLPAVPALRLEDDTAAVTIEELKGSGQTLLLVEDEESVRLMAEKMLSNNGYRVLVASNADEAFRIFTREKGCVDAIFSDVMMPGEDGISLADHLVEYDAKLPVILTSGHETSVDDWQSIEANGYHFLPKPYNLVALLSELNRVFSSN